MTAAGLLAAASYLVAATLFLLGLQRMASPRTARSGIRCSPSRNNVAATR